MESRDDQANAVAKASCLLMKCLHQCDGAYEEQQAKLPLGPAGPVYARPLRPKGHLPLKKREEAVWFSFPRQSLRNASLRSAPEYQLNGST